MKANVYEIITNRIIEELEKGVIPWRKPWTTSKKALASNQYFPCYPLGSNKPYDILNQMLLGFKPGHYATYKKISDLGGKINKGEQSAIIAGWIHTKEKITNKNNEPILDENGNEQYKDTFALRYYNVFCIETQTSGIDIDEVTEDFDPYAPIVNPCEIAENIINTYVDNEDLTLTRDKVGNRAYYSPSLDEVVVPHIAQFTEQAEYYSTVFHELTHSTMKATRCNREETRKGKNVAFGSEEYSKEELVAELGAGTLVNICGLETTSSFSNSASYISGWSKKLKEQPKMIVYASAQAQKAIDYILAN